GGRGVDAGLRTALASEIGGVEEFHPAGGEVCADLCGCGLRRGRGVADSEPDDERRDGAVRTLAPGDKNSEVVNEASCGRGRSVVAGPGAQLEAASGGSRHGRVDAGVDRDPDAVRADDGKQVVDLRADQPVDDL